MTSFCCLSFVGGGSHTTLVVFCFLRLDCCQTFVKNVSNRLVDDFVFFPTTASTQTATSHRSIVVFGFFALDELVVSCLCSIWKAATPHRLVMFYFLHRMTAAHRLFFHICFKQVACYFWSFAAAVLP